MSKEVEIDKLRPDVVEPSLSIKDVFGDAENDGTFFIVPLVVE